MSAPIEVTVKRYICPHCHRGRSSRKATAAHIGQCWRNPANRSCKTCAWFRPADGNSDESCANGVTIGEPRERAIKEEWAEYGTGWVVPNGTPEPESDPAPFPFNCEIWEERHD